ncbi:YdcF family protein [Gloeobacter kilaueensis]|uniref:DUF218 domain-containing protein n=1 Tax=Gloeobacter kilaueensis (strain ATCC BAA-2537 / CCAP 1431/1 / ULC 316 / JS1) TaxID=1183438 RepID=U5QNR7_GLOK1|nr:YdcF family protein [Gloeobacter kilaueensis]AGY59239.1 hypothetical protein GKIL_2993 [Gloeobacter kilaueensis JS1]
MFLYLSKVLPAFIYPIGLSMVLVVAVALLGRRWPKTAIGLCGAVFLLLGIFASPLVSTALLGSLESQYPGGPIAKLPTAQAIVVLGGSVRMPTRLHDGVELAEASDRVLHAARLFRAGKAPVILMSGGNVPFYSEPGQLPEAQYMRRLIGEFGVPAKAVLVETGSQNTFENAQQSSALLLPQAVRRILLVTSAYHMPRSVAIFRRAGFEVIPAATDFRSDAIVSDWLLTWLPTAEAMDNSTLALKEWVGLLVYRLRGWA